MDYSQIKGFNYQPSWGSTGFEIWRNFDAERMGHEIALGKAYFPRMNAIRLWLSHDAWLRNPSRFEAAFETAMGIADTHDLSVMPVLFNRWHCATLDYGGIYIDHFLPKASWVQGKDQPAAFAEAIVGAHATDSRILAWDLCNEPFSYNCPPSDIPEIVSAEYAWLERTYGIAKRCGSQAPITVGIHPGHGLDGIRQIERISDVLSIHPYWTCDSPVRGKDAYEKSLDDYVQFATKRRRTMKRAAILFALLVIATAGCRTLSNASSGHCDYLIGWYKLPDRHYRTCEIIPGPGTLIPVLKKDGIYYICFWRI